MVNPEVKEAIDKVYELILTDDVWRALHSWEWAAINNDCPNLRLALDYIVQGKSVDEILEIMFPMSILRLTRSPEVMKRYIQQLINEEKE